MHPSAASSKFRRRLVDTYPIVFPAVSVSAKAETIPSDFDPSGDLIVDPYGNIYCFVCQVSVPKGASNLSQHLGGKKHDTNNKRFDSAHEKQLVRANYITAATEQRSTIFPDPSLDQPAPAQPQPIPCPKPSPAPFEPSVSATPSTAIPPAPLSKEKMKKAKRHELANKFKATTIDKSAYLDSLLSGVSGDHEDAEFSDSADESYSETIMEDPTPRTLSTPASLDLEERSKPFAPLNFKPVPFPVAFVDATAEESEPTETAAKIRDILSSTPVAKPDKMNISQNSDDIAGAEGSGANVKPVASAEDKEDAGEYIRVSDNTKGVNSGGEDGSGLKRAGQPARESFLILKDRNGEELPPWLLESDATQNVLYSFDSSIALHFEILQFSRFVSPTDEELNSRNEMVMTVESIVKQLWPSSSTELFGSYATGLYLPTSDVDICVMGTPDVGAPKEFEQLAAAIRNVKGFAKRVHVIKAKVPLVKIISRKTGMNCDICIGRDNGPKNVPVIKEYLSTYPALRPLLMVVKCFLQQRDLNDTYYYGGLGSYTLFLLVVSHLQMLKYNFPGSKANLGAVLQTFFQLYGRAFNLCIAGIRVKDNGSYLDKFDKYETTPQDTMRFSVEDPNDETNELGRNGYAATRVRKAFNNASVTLINWRRNDSSAAPTPLAAILQYDDHMKERRKIIIEDMERKGLLPLRESITEGESGTKRQSRSASRSDDVMVRSKEARTATYLRERDPRGRDPRDRKSRDPRERNPKERSSRERDPRDRDPRLAKRRRTSSGQESERPREGQGTASFNGAKGVNNKDQSHNDGGNKGQSSRNQRNHNIDQSRGMGRFESVSDPNSHHPSVYRTQPSYSDYPVRQYPVSTPGYQYVDQQATYPSNGGVDLGMYATTPGYVSTPQQGAQQIPDGVPNSYNQSHMYTSGRRGRSPKKRGAYPRRGGYGGR